MSQPFPTDDARALLRHTIATLAYRAEKVLRAVPANFAALRAGQRSRSALELAAHLGDLMEWAERMAQGEARWAPAPQIDWETAVARFFVGLQALDRAVAAPDFVGDPRVIFQGPIADALTHIGQLALLRGLARDPVRPESYARAEIAIGRVGRDQSTTRSEFDGDASPQQPKP